MADFVQKINPQGGVKHLTGTGSPEGVVTGYVGNHYLDNANADVYYKASGDNSNTGWTLINGAGGLTPLFDTGTILISLATSMIGALKFDGVSSYSKSIYSALYTLISNEVGTAFDVDANNFYLPDPSGRALAIAGQGSGLTGRTLFQIFGAERHILSVNEMPSHGHSGSVALPRGDQSYNNGGGNTLWGGSNNRSFSLSIGNAGGGQSHNNMQPTFFAGKHLYIYF